VNTRPRENGAKNAIYMGDFQSKIEDEGQDRGNTREAQKRHVGQNSEAKENMI